MNTMEDQDDDQSSTNSFSVVDKTYGHRNHQENPDEVSPKSTLEEPPVEEIAKVAYLDFSIGIYQNIHVPGNGPRRFYHDPVVIIDPKSVKSESNELCFKVKMGDTDIRALVLARLLSLESFANINIQLNDISTMPYEEIRLLIQPGSVLKSTKQMDESISYYIQLRDSLDFIFQFEYPNVAEELVKDFKKNPEIVTKKWMLGLECKGLALGSGCKPLETMSVSKRRPTWIFPVSTLPSNFDDEARTRSVIDNLLPRLEGCEILIESLKNEIKELQTKQVDEDDGILDRISDLEVEVDERLERNTTASREREDAKAVQIRDLQAELRWAKSVSSATDGRTHVLEGKVTTLANIKLPSAIPIFSVRKCINPSAAANQSFGYATHDFDAKIQHGQIDLPTGIFTVQTPGIYQLNFNCNVNINCTSHPRHYFQLRVDGVSKGSSLNITASETEGYQPVVISVLLKLNAAQKVGVFVVDSGRLYECDPGLVTLFSATLFVNQRKKKLVHVRSVAAKNLECGQII